MNLFFAHAFGERYELPIPLALFMLAGATVVFISFALILNRRVKSVDSTGEDGPAVQPLNSVLAILSIIALLGLVAIGIFGNQEVPENLLPTWFWVISWIGIALSVGIIGDWTGALNPFANLAKIADSPSLRKLLLARPQPFAWPDWLGWWPAVGLFFAVVCAELIFNQTATIPAVIGGGLLAYAVLSKLMGLLFGPAWIKHGELFTTIFSTWGRLGYWRFGTPGRRGFLGGLDVPFQATPSRIAFVLLLLVSVSFDGLLSTPAWAHFATHLPDNLAVGTTGYKLFAVLIFALLAAAIWGIFTAFATAVARVGEHKSTPQQALAGLLPSLLPISYGYLLAHYLQYLLINGQLVLPLLGNPTGSETWPLHLAYPFNDNFEVNTHLLPNGAYWYIAVAAIVIVHVLAVILAHRHLATTAKTTTAARQSEYPWIIAMVAYTVFSLWLLAQPLVD